VARLEVHQGKQVGQSKRHFAWGALAIRVGSWKLRSQAELEIIKSLGVATKIYADLLADLLETGCRDSSSAASNILDILACMRPR
jgi:hypothetical protein